MRISDWSSDVCSADLLDARTLRELNVPVDDRIAAIMANMERWRWMPRQLPVNRVQVNIAAAVLTVFEGDEPVTSMRAVTGAPDNATPMLVSSIHSIEIGRASCRESVCQYV